MEVCLVSPSNFAIVKTEDGSVPRLEFCRAMMKVMERPVNQKPIKPHIFPSRIPFERVEEENHLKNSTRYTCSCVSIRGRRWDVYDFAQHKNIYSYNLGLLHNNNVILVSITAADFYKRSFDIPFQCILRLHWTFRRIFNVA